MLKAFLVLRTCIVFRQKYRPGNTILHFAYFVVRRVQRSKTLSNAQNRSNLVKLFLSSGLEHYLVHRHGVLAGERLAFLGIPHIRLEPRQRLLLHLLRICRKSLRKPHHHSISQRESAQQQRYGSKNKTRFFFVFVHVPSILSCYCIDINHISMLNADFSYGSSIIVAKNLSNIIFCFSAFFLAPFFLSTR